MTPTSTLCECPFLPLCAVLSRSVMSNSLRPYGLKLTRLLLNEIKVKNHVSISRTKQKVFDKILHSLIKTTKTTLNKLGINEKFTPPDKGHLIHP